ncbi:MAG: hypothetical protein J6P69_02065, partial [Bacteroidales bacterium]|nr:hypothetical protein [Bacteroidales bacterium]
MKRVFVSLMAVLFGLCAAFAQETKTGIPEEVFYLMPKFGTGYVVYEGQAPMRGLINICAIDNSVRFKDSNGQEMAADNPGSIQQVVIDNTSFMRNGNQGFARLVSVAPGGEVAVAVKRDVTVMTDSKRGAYGMESQTTAVQEYTGFSSTNRMYVLDEMREFPYRVSESASLFKDGSFMPINKR